MSPTIVSFAMLAIGLLASPSAAYFRMSCSQIAIGRIDPVVSAGHLSAHAHKIAGPSKIGLDSTYASLQTANCTSCEIQADKSAYWTPLLYYQYANGSFEEVGNKGMTVYYLGRGDNHTAIVPFPPGFCMVSGDATLRSYNSSPKTYKDARPIADRVSFACLDKDPSPETPLMSNTNCANGLRAQIHFQSCWDGVNLYKPDNSHVAYLSGIDNGVCPPTHATLLVHLFFEVLYAVHNIQQESGGKFVFSTGDTQGAGFHGDFLNGWDEGVLREALKECANTGNDMIDSCGPLQESHIKKTAEYCPMQKPSTSEPMRGLIDRLPGCRSVDSGTGSVPDVGCIGDGVAQAVAGVLGFGNSTNGTVRRVRKGAFL